MLKWLLIYIASYTGKLIDDDMKTYIKASVYLIN